MSSEAVNVKAKDVKSSKDTSQKQHHEARSPSSNMLSPSQRAPKTQREKEATTRRKSRKQKKGDESPKSKKERRRDDSTDGKDSYRQRKQNSADKGSGESAKKKSGESTDKRSSRREKKHSLEKQSGEGAMSPSQKQQVCSDTFGYGADFVDDWLQEARLVEHKVEPPKKVPMVKVSKTLIIYEVPGDLTDQLEIGDILYKFNNLRLGSRDEYTKQLAFAMKNPDPQSLEYTIIRPIRTKVIPHKDLLNTVPPGFEILPDLFDYFHAIMTIAPKTVLGMTIKGYNGKVYVSGIEHSTNSIAYKCLLVGDAILEIEDQVISGVKDADEALCSYFGKKKFVRMIVERAKNPAGVRLVKLALSVEKTFEVNPRMTEDVIEICEHQLSVMAKNPDAKPENKIFKCSSARASTSHVDVAREVMELPIATDVNNLTLLAPTPAPPSVAPGTQGSFDPLGRTAKRLVRIPNRARSK